METLKSRAFGSIFSYQWNVPPPDSQTETQVLQKVRFFSSPGPSMTTVMPSMSPSLKIPAMKSRRLFRFRSDFSASASSNLLKCFSQMIFSGVRNGGVVTELMRESRIWSNRSVSESPRMISSEGLSSGGSPQSPRMKRFTFSLIEKSSFPKKRWRVPLIISRFPGGTSSFRSATGWCRRSALRRFPHRGGRTFPRACAYSGSGC